MKTLKIGITAFFLSCVSLFANYESTYIPDQVKKDFSESKYSKYQIEAIPTVLLPELKNKGVFSESATLVRHVSGTPDFNAIVAADVCQVDGVAAYSSTIYEIDLPSGVVTCLYAVKNDLYNPQGLFKITSPEIKAYYAINTDAAKEEKVGDIAVAEAQFLPLLEKKQEIAATMVNNANSSFLSIPELLMAAVLADDEIIDIEATRATGKFQLKSGFTSKFTDSGEAVDNTEYLLADAATIFDVYVGLGGVSMTFLLILVTGFAVVGLGRHFGSNLVSKIEKKKYDDSNIPYAVGLIIGILFFFPTSQSNKAVGDAAEYELLKTRYQGFEKFGYYTFSDWGKASAKVVIDSEIDALIRKSGLGTKEQIVSTWAQITQSTRMDAFYLSNYNMCLNTIYDQANLTHEDGKSVYSETDKGMFPSTEHWAWAAFLAKPLTNKYYLSGVGGLLRGGAAAEGEYPKFAFSSCGKADYLSNFYREKKVNLKASYDVLTQNNNQNSPKIAAMTKVIEFQYKLYRDWGYLAVLGLPVTKMQSNIASGIQNQNSVVLEKLNANIGGDNKILHSVLSSLPYMVLPGAKSVFDFVSANSIAIGGASGAIIGSQADGNNGVLSAFYSVVGAIDGAVIGSTNAGGAAIGSAFAYQFAKVLLEIAPVLGLVIIGILRFVIILLKVLSFHFLSLFMMPIMFIKDNVRGITGFTVKILATMLEIPVFVLSIYLASVASGLVDTIGTVFGKKIMIGMLDNASAINSINPVEAGGANLSNLFTQMQIYVFDGFMEVVIAVFSIVIIYKLVISLHTMLFETVDLAASSAIDNSIEGMKSESSSWGTRV